ncbi:MAG: porin family protein [Candidatus Thiodiazotropha sp. (ex Semelilucina semeliformis)]|nr:porin family protein [Candidatus Thiodiazotropha sp. (ex Semelilucina semeliformis)]
MDRVTTIFPIFCCAGFALIFPVTSLAFEGHVELGFGHTRSKPDIENASYGIIDDSSLDKTGDAVHILFGTPITKDLMVEIAYRDFGTTLSDVDNFWLKQETQTYDLQLKYRFFNKGKISLHVAAGITNWHSKLEQQFWFTSTLDPLWRWGAKTVEKTSDYTPKIGLGLRYMITDRVSIGVQYNYYRRLGDGEKVINREKIPYGDLVGALTGHQPLKFSLETYNLTFGYRF